MKKFIQTLKNIWSIDELRNKITFTLLLIFIYTIGTHIVLPGIDPNQLAALSQNQSQNGLLGLLNTFVGGSFNRASIFALGIMPYISASIFMQLVTILVPQMAKIQKVLYVSGEESERQIKMRAVRLLNKKAELPKNLLLVTETNLEVILNHVHESKPDLLIVDSIQTVYLSALDSSAGSVSQVRESSSHLRELAKSSGVSVFMIGHVTKGGGIAGPKTLEHAVDAVLQFDGDVQHEHRVLRALKNRFGSTHEIAVFTMTGAGLEAVENPSSFFLDPERSANPAPGSAHVASLEGTRPLLIEIQALVAPSSIMRLRPS